MTLALFRSANPQYAALRDDRLRRALPWSLNPFHETVQAPEEDDNRAKDRKRGGLQDHIKHSTTFMWTDLMLDLAMAATFANLTENTKIDSGTSAVSYVFFFALVFWTWMSTCMYNIRYRQDDWVHRIYAFLQLGVYGAFSAFTADFNITEGIRPDKDLAELLSSRLEDGYSDSSIAAEQARLSRLPGINARGISLVMAASRLILLLPYIIVYIHAGKLRNKTLLYPIISVSTSALLYLIAFGVVRADGPDALKLVLWFFPLLIEPAALYAESYMADNVGFNGHLIWDRFSTVLAVIIGEGLNGITGTFKFLVGAVGFDASSAMAMISVVVIIFLLWALYYETGDNLKEGNRRAISWGLIHFLYFSCIILSLEAMKGILVANNLTNALDQITAGFTQIQEAQNSIHALDQLNITMTQLGVSLDDEIQAEQNIVDVFDNFSDDDYNTYPLGPNFGLEYMQAHINQFALALVYTVFKQFDAVPDENDALYANLTDFAYAVPYATDYDYLAVTSADNLNRLYRSLLTPVATAVLWYAATAGGTLVCLAVLNHVQRPAHDRYGWGSVLSKFTIGMIFISLSFMDVGGLKDTRSGDLESSRVMLFLYSGWMLPAFAITLVVTAIIDYILLYLAARSYRRQNASTEAGPVLEKYNGSLGSSSTFNSAFERRF